MTVLVCLRMSIGPPDHCGGRCSLLRHKANSTSSADVVRFDPVAGCILYGTEARTHMEGRGRSRPDRQISLRTEIFRTELAVLFTRPSASGVFGTQDHFTPRSPNPGAAILGSFNQPYLVALFDRAREGRRSYRARQEDVAPFCRVVPQARAASSLYRLHQHP